MNEPQSQTDKGKLEPFPEGEIRRRLAALPDLTGKATEPVDAYRAAAAVLVAFEPGKLKPAPVGADTLKSPLELLPASIPAPHAEKRAGYPWTLPADNRKEALRELHSEKALQQALRANPKRPDSLLQQTLSGAINGSSNFEVARMGPEELSALATVADWLDETEISGRLPEPASVREVLEQRRHRDSLERLRGEAFTGREAETARIQTYFNSIEASVLWVAAPGGTGKSALISHALLSWVPSAGSELLDPEKIWVRLDLDSSSVKLDQPMSLVAEAGRQLSRRFPDEELLPGLVRAAESAASTPAQGNADFESFGRGTWDHSEVVHMFQSFLLVLTKSFRKRFVIWVDTFEEAQFLGETVVRHLLELIGEVSARHVPIRVVISGRAGPGAVTAVGPRKIEQIQLTDLPDPPASDLLGKFVRQIEPAKVPGSEALKKAVGILGGNPLTLRLAARLLAKGGGETLEKFESVKKKALHRQLYSRVLEHIHEDDVCALAMPGLVVRRITPEIIQQVLAVPCGLKIENLRQAQELFEKVASEITLVERDGADALVHVQHVRKLMLEAMPASLEKAIGEIDHLAAAFWQERSGPQARAEEIYHRLRMKQSAEELDRRWDAAAGAYLADALEELPAGTTEHAWLASRLRVESSGSEPGEEVVPQSVWERAAETDARRLLAANQYPEALAVLSQRGERLPGSPLYGLESRALLFHGDPVAARVKAMEGVEASRTNHKSVAVDLALFAAFIDERTGEYARSLEAADLAVRISRLQEDQMINLSALLRKIRHHRAAAAKDVINPRRQTVENRRKAARSIAIDVGPNRLAGNPTVLRELAAELGDLEPEFLRWASNSLLEELLGSMPLERVVMFVRDTGLVHGDEARRLSNSASSEVVKVARHAILERISSRDPQPAFAKRLQQLYRDAVDAIFARDYTAAEKQAAPPTPPDRTKASAVELEDLISRYLQKLPEDVSAMIARFGAALSQGSFKSLTRDPSAVGKALLKRAEQLHLVPQLLAQLEDYVAKHLPEEDLTVLHDYQTELRDKKAGRNKHKK